MRARKRFLLRVLLSTMLVVYFSMSSVRVATALEEEPNIQINHVATLGPTDLWHVIVDYPDGSPSEDFLIEGTKSEPSLLSAQSELLSRTISKVDGTQIVQEDILLGFSYSWDYTLEIMGKTFDVLEFYIDLGLPVRIELQYQEPMIEGVSYPILATLTPLDWPSFNEFTCSFSVIGRTVFDISESFVTPFGLENALTLEIGPFWFASVPFLGFSLDLGLEIVPQLFSDRMEAHLEVTGDATLLSLDTLIWDAPGQTLQFDTLAEDVSALDYASILLSQFECFINRFLVDFDLALQFNFLRWPIWRGRLGLFTLDASKLFPTLSFGTHPSSLISEIQADIQVVTIEHVIPEVPIGTIVASASMAIALVAYFAVPKWRRKQKHINS